MFLKKSTVVLMLVFAASSIFAQEKKENDDFVKFGGALRFNVFSKSWVDNKTQPEATIDTWRLNVTARKKGVDLNFEYRFYPTFGTHFMKQGWLGYGLTDNLYMKLGVSQVPFGITTYASHSWWFQAPYYVGLEDDYDMGVKFDISKIENLDLSVAYYRQSEPEGPIFGGDVTFGQSGAGRYSYDLTPSAGSSNRELNQFNLRAAYHIGDGLEIGASGQIGGIHNTVLNEATTSTAFAGHLVADFSNFNFKGEVIYYDYAAKDDAGNDVNTLSMGAYGSSYPVATNATMYVAGLAYTIPVEIGPISSVQAYVDYTYTDKLEDSFVDMHHLIPGFMITAGSIYTYVDFAMGKNQPWLTSTFGTGLGEGQLYSDDAASKYYTDDAGMQGTPVPMDELDWETRFNINIGYYF
ncbi:MAG TPA: hypothetical protein VJ937_02530 [Salinivirga sp.]|uniref:hypothetical protein n=1 Tax=Salinivirga sp. TaxID=1970192 RepID=UPI002B499923|nr:hypothetical protein [Salinivirga sp.]HKK58330.1 hypothetical protein [Salinivirga sp.]